MNMNDIMLGQSPLFDLHLRNIYNFQIVSDEIGEAMADPKRDPAKENLYNNLMFCLCEQLDLYQKTAEANADTNYYKVSQLFAERDVEQRNPMRGLMQETIKLMHAINEQYETNKPFDNIFILAADALSSPTGTTAPARFAELKGILKGEFEAYDNAVKYVQQYTDAMETPINKLTTRQKDLLDEKNLPELGHRMARIAKTKVLLDSVLQPMMHGKDGPGNGRVLQPLSQEEEKAYGELKKLVEKYSKKISQHEKSLDYKTDLTPEGYRFKQTYGHKGVLDKFTFQSHTYLMDRQFGLKSFECELDCHCKIAQWTNSPGVKCEMTVHVPTPLNGTKINVNFQDDWETVRESLKLYHQTAEKGWDMGKKLGESIFSFDKISDGIGMLVEGVKTMTIGFMKDTTVRFVGRNGFGEIDDTLSLMDALPHMAKKPWMLDLKFAKDEFVSEYLPKTPDWIKYREDAIKKACLESAKEAVKLGLNVSQSNAMGSIKNAVSIYENLRDMKEVDMGSLPTLAQQSARTMSEYATHLGLLEVAAERERHQISTHTRTLEELNLVNDFGEPIVHAEDMYSFVNTEEYILQTMDMRVNIGMKPDDKGHGLHPETVQLVDEINGNEDRDENEIEH